MPADKHKSDSKQEEATYAAEQYAVNDYAVPAEYAQYYGTEYAEGQGYDYSDPNVQYDADPGQYTANPSQHTADPTQYTAYPNQYNADPNQYYYDYSGEAYADPNATDYNYDQYYAQQGYYDQNAYQPVSGMTGSGTPLPESVTAIQSAATAAANKYSTPTTGSPAPPKVYYPSTANSNNPVGPIIITKSGYAGPHPSTTPSTPESTTDKNKKSKKKTAVRAAGGEVWEDNTLEDWDDNDFRLFAGDLGNEVTEELLYKAFSKYPSLLRTRVVRDTRTMKSKGFGFISFKDPDDFVKAWREMNGKYVGNRPIKLRKSTWKERNADVRAKKERDRVGPYTKHR